MDKTINELYVDYLNFLKLKNKITTVELIKYKFKNHILPYFGKMIPNDITEQIYINYQIQLRQLNYSSSFYEQMHTIVKNFFDYLFMLYGINNIPLKVGNAENKNNKIITEKAIWNEKEFKKFIRQVDDKIYHALFNLLFYTGLRKGEALALKITDIDKQCINVNKTITKELFNGSRKIMNPKSKSSVRKIRIDFLLNIELNRLIKYYSKNYDNFNNNFFLFGGNKPIATTTLERKKNNYCKNAKVKQIRIHDFRHSHATMLHNKNIKLKAIQKRLGHADISTTINTYIHLDKNEEKKLIRMINLIRF